MTYKKVNPRKAARRHLAAANVLDRQSGPGDQPGCRAVAGYLYGIAGELAVKQMMLNVGLDPSEPAFYKHFPELKSMLSTVPGPHARELRRIANNSALFQHWHTKMRYVHTSEIQDAWVDRWKRSAEDLINQMEAV